VEGLPVNYYDELVETGLGIASLRAGRLSGEIKQGQNVRAEYEESGVLRADQLYVDQIGSETERVTLAYFEDIYVNGVLDTSSLNVDNDITANGSITVEGDITAATGIGTFANIVVTANSTLNGVTNINGNLFVNGVSTQTLGSETEVIEDSYFGNIDVQDLVVDSSADISNLAVTGGSFTSTVDLSMLGTANIDLASGQLNGAATQVVLEDRSTSATTQYITFVDALTGKETVATDGGLLYVPDTGNLTITGYFEGAATQVAAQETDTDNEFYLTFVADDDAATSPKQTVFMDTEISYNPNTNILSVGGNVDATYFNGVATSAWYADLAENYTADTELSPGTVVMIGGSAEVTVCDTDACTDVFGVVSTDPAYLMNSGIDGVPVALQGRVPVKVLGPCSKGDRLVSSGVAGYARAIGNTAYDPRIVIGRALANKTDEGQGTVEAVIGVK
jgi:hypothetical protein